MIKLSKERFLQMTEGAVSVSSDSHGDKVLISPEGTVFKLFRRKRVLSSAIFLPYAYRFKRSALRLCRLGFSSVEAMGLYRIPPIKRDMVVYKRLEVADAVLG